MSNNIKYSFRSSISKIGLPLIFVTQENDSYGFMFLIDTSSKENFIDPQYLEYYKPSDYSRLVEVFDGPPEVFERRYDKYTDVYKRTGSKKVILRTGEKKEMEKYIVHFSVTEYKFKGNFFVCNIANSYKPCGYKCKFIGVLGNRFLKKNKWIIDYDQQVIIIK